MNEPKNNVVNSLLRTLYCENRTDIYHVNNSILYLIFLFVTIFCSSGYGQIQEGFPYTAKVCVRNAAARSGPGLSFYATQSLPPGSVVEVYCELPTGWAAIRPPQGSFSWVRGKFLESMPDGTGRVTEDNTASGVGSALQDSRDVVQVRMNKDERVEIIQKTNIGAEEWYRISPPSGEFRWVNLNDILPDDPVRRTPQQTQRSQNPSALAASPVPLPGRRFQPGMRPQPPAPYPPRRPQGMSDEDFYRELTALERGWDAMLHYQPSYWRSGELLQRAMNLKYYANTRDKLARVDILISRLRRANEMERAAGVPQPGRPGYPPAVPPPPTNPLIDPNSLPPGAKATVLPGLESSSAEFHQQLANAAAPYPLPPPPDAAMPSAASQHNIDTLLRADELEKNLRLDGIGILAPLPQGSVERLPIRWALLDANGQVRYYVSPSLGVHFKGMEGQVVGVIGSREYLPNNDRHIHITVRRIRPL